MTWRARRSGRKPDASLYTQKRLLCLTWRAMSGRPWTEEVAALRQGGSGHQRQLGGAGGVAGAGAAGGAQRQLAGAGAGAAVAGGGDRLGRALQAALRLTQG